MMRASTTSMLRRNLELPLTVLSGAMVDMFSNLSMASRKMENSAQALQDFPAARLVLLGDSGQGDVAWHQAVLSSGAGHAVHASLIHDVVHNRGRTPRTPPSRRAEILASGGPFLFDTYLEAALVAFQLGALSALSLVRVASDVSTWFLAAIAELELEADAAKQSGVELVAQLDDWLRGSGAGGGGPRDDSREAAAVPDADAFEAAGADRAPLPWPPQWLATLAGPLGGGSGPLSGKAAMLASGCKWRLGMLSVDAALCCRLLAPTDGEAGQLCLAHDPPASTGWRHKWLAHRCAELQLALGRVAVALQIVASA
ncbi:hypothetical protein FNF27_00900 [Cafeteria roenbergensis]|uniref:Phosphatidate phosphatase APP1 catalytic domain-containing protein n=1 Tax=Cafeteria roenbergensis TaxID=33653 RepID=A0A5A8EKP9_CAFRO|nr:hypothetical protein FNF27_00900 [Cafeteria roenbergensis]